MGITAFEIKLMEDVLGNEPSLKDVCELGSQNLYSGNEANPPFADIWYKKRGLNYYCIDLAGDNNAAQIDLSRTITEEQHNKFDIVTDFGTSEHVVQMEKYNSVAFHDGYINSIYPDGIENIEEGYYNCWANKHKVLRVGGVMFNVNPKSGNWPGHGYSYLTKDFYYKLADACGYQIMELGEHAAMGNITDGWNIYCVLKKVNDNPFPSFEKFQEFGVQKS